MTQDHWSHHIAYYYQSMGRSLRLPPNSELIRDLINYKYKRRENMVDYSKIRAGDTVKFRCGGSAVVQEGYFFGHAAKLKFAGSDDSIHYDLTHHRTSVFDVVEVIPKPFEWKDLKPGMAFKYREQIVYYCFSDNRGTRHYSMESFSCPQIIYPDIGDRVPQYDVKGIS